MPRDAAPARFPPGPYAFAGYPILCSIACAVPLAPVRRAVAAGAAVFSFGLAAFILPLIARDFPHIYVLESIEVLLLTCVIGAGTAVYALTGKLLRRLSIIVHRSPNRE